MSQGRRLAVLGLVIVVAVAGFVIAKSGSDSNDKSGTKTETVTTPAGVKKTETVRTGPAPVHIVVQGGKPAGGIKKINVNKGDPVRFTVTSDVADEIHVHGYDFHKDVKKGGSVSFDFPAKIDGVFVIELESRGEQIASLQVEP